VNRPGRGDGMHRRSARWSDGSSRPTIASSPPSMGIKVTWLSNSVTLRRSTLFGKFIHADPTVVVMVPERDEDRRESPELGQKAQQMRQSVAHVHKIPGDEDPVGLQFGYGADQGAMAGTISVQVQVAQLDGAASGQGSMGQPQRRVMFGVGEADLRPGIRLKR
jgi:hypothetical protein